MKKLYVDASSLNGGGAFVLETGKQAVLLNKILEDNPFNWKPEEFQMKLKEYVGHTPLQVLMGAILGIATAFWMRGFY